MVLLLCEATGGSSTMSEGHDTFLLRGRRRHGRIHVAGTASMPLEPMHHDLSKPSPHVEAAQTHISAPFGRASGAASQAAPGEALPNVCFVTGFTCEAGSEVIGGLQAR